MTNCALTFMVPEYFARSRRMARSESQSPSMAELHLSVAAGGYENAQPHRHLNVGRRWKLNVSSTHDSFEGIQSARIPCCSMSKIAAHNAFELYSCFYNVRTLSGVLGAVGKRLQNTSTGADNCSVCGGTTQTRPKAGCVLQEVGQNSLTQRSSRKDSPLTMDISHAV